MARILLGVSGGIAAYKAIEIARLATQAGHGVRVLMTPGAGRFVGPATFEGIVGAPVLVGEFDHDPMGGRYPGEPLADHEPISHLALPAGADVLLVAPCTANTLAKLAGGICDSMLTTAFLAADCPRIVAPAMNDRMWADAATAANVELLRRRGVTVVDPDSGALASRGEHGAGRLPEPPRLLELAERLASSPPDPDRQATLSGGPGRRTLVTAGGTREPIDPVRFIGNRSSGRMGFSLAAEAARRGDLVTLVAANVSLPTPPGVERIDVVTAAELEAACRERFADTDLLLMAAAVADFRPRNASGGKLVREGGEVPQLELEATADVLAGLAEGRREGQVLVGFAAEHGGQFVERARAKLERKGVDAVVVNDVSDPAIGFESGHNEVTVVSAGDQLPIPRGSKHEVARAILDEIGGLRPGEGDQGV